MMASARLSFTGFASDNQRLTYRPEGENDVDIDYPNHHREGLKCT